VTYAADWTEYFGHHPQDGSGDVSFHLDPLWASPHIDAVGIDAYFPLSDWREGDHLDSVNAPNIYDISYLQSQIEGAIFKARLKAAKVMIISMRLRRRGTLNPAVPLRMV